MINTQGSAFASPEALESPSRTRRCVRTERTPLIDAAQTPARGRLTEDSYDRLRAALAPIFGPERGVLRLGEGMALGVKSWGVRALVWAALVEARQEHSSTNGASISPRLGIVPVATPRGR